MKAENAFLCFAKAVYHTFPPLSSRFCNFVGFFADSPAIPAISLRPKLPNVVLEKPDGAGRTCISIARTVCVLSLSLPLRERFTSGAKHTPVSATPANACAFANPTPVSATPANACAFANPTPVSATPANACAFANPSPARQAEPPLPK